MRFNWVYCLLLILLNTFSVFVEQAQAANLLTVYQQALVSDPVFQIAKAKWQKDREQLALAKSSIMPHLALSGFFFREHNRARLGSSLAASLGFSVQDAYSKPYGYGATLSQSIFNFNHWMKIAGAKAVVKQAQASYTAAAQALILRVAKHYFEVMKAREDKKLAYSELMAVSQQLKQAKSRYEVGVIAITGYHDAKARYDIIKAEDIAAKENLHIALEELKEITGVRSDVEYSVLSGVDTDLPLLLPKPASVDRWVHQATHYNYTLLAAHYGMLAAKQAVRSSRSQRYPTLDLVANYNVNKGTGSEALGVVSAKQANVGLELAFPVYQGGSITAQTRQAVYEYERQSAYRESVYRQVVKQTRESFLSVLTIMSKIKADRQAVISTQSALDSNKAGYRVGTRTMVDVLTSQAVLYKAKRDLLHDTYDYLFNILLLKQAAGRLKGQDIVSINRWLTRNDRLYRGHAFTSTSVSDASFVKLTNTSLPADWTLQLLAVHDRLSLLRVLNRYDKRYKGKLFYVKVKSRKPSGKYVFWYKLYYGRYRSWKQVRLAYKHLEGRLNVDKSIHPWITRIPSGTVIKG